MNNTVYCVLNILFYKKNNNSYTTNNTTNNTNNNTNSNNISCVMSTNE